MLVSQGQCANSSCLALIHRFCIVLSKMKCNACWRELEGQAVSTTCGHLLCTEDAKKILSNDGACPICDQVLSKSHMRPMDINPSNDWTNMAMAGVSPQILMKSAYRSVMFYIGQKELEMQYNMNRIVDQCRQKCVLMQAKFTEKLEEVHSAYQKMAKRCQLMEQEVENLTRDKQELQEKFAEKSRQKRKLDEMYDQLRSEYESVKRSSMEPTNNFLARPQPNLFTGTPNMMDGGDPLRQGRRDEGWGPAPRQGRCTSGPFKLSAESHVHAAAPPVDIRPRQPARRVFGATMNNPSAALRDLIISPVKRPLLSRNCCRTGRANGMDALLWSLPLALSWSWSFPCKLCKINPLFFCLFGILCWCRKSSR